MAALAVLALATATVPAPATAANSQRQVLVSGAVTPTPPDGTVVSIHAWPRFSTPEPMGATFALPLVAQATTTSGRFSVPVPADVRPLRDAANGGDVVNLAAFVRTPAEGGARFFSFDLAAQDPREVVIPLERLPVDELQPGPPDAGAVCEQLLPVPSSPDAAPATAQSGCTTPNASPCYAHVIDTTVAYDTIGEIHVPSGASGEYTYSIGAKTELEVKVSLSGEHGPASFSSAGTTTEVKHSASDAGWRVGEYFANQLQTQFYFYKYQLKGYGCPPSLTIKSNQWYAGATVGVGVGQWDNKCFSDYKTWKADYAAGTFMTKTAGKGFNYKIGATVFLVSVESKTDWTTQNRFQINFTKDSVMCGNDGPIPASSLVYMQA